MADRTSNQALQGILRALETDDINAARYILASFHAEARDELKALLRPVEPAGDNGLYCEQDAAHDPADGPMSAAVCLGCWNKLAQEAIELRKQVRTPVEPEPSRSVQRRIAVQRGEQPPEFGPSEKVSAPPTGSVLDRKVTVCAACLCACCWQGEFQCDQARTAGTVEKSIRELLQGNLREDSGYWFKDPNTGQVDYDAKATAKRAWLAESGEG